MGMNYASTYMGSWEKELFSRSPRHPLAYFRFVDDVWGIYENKRTCFAAVYHAFFTDTYRMTDDHPLSLLSGLTRGYMSHAHVRGVNDGAAGAAAAVPIIG